MNGMTARRHVLALLASLPLGALPRSLRALESGRGAGPHPTPRPGVDASKVLAAADLDGDTEVLEVFDKVREIPQVVDGIRCHCGCADLPGFYSLLSCYEDAGMARHCQWMPASFEHFPVLIPLPSME